MKYSAFALILGGIGTACFAVFMSTSAGPTGQANTESTGNLPHFLLLGFAAALFAAGAVMWKFGGKGYTVTNDRNAGSSRRPLKPADGTN